MKQSNGTANLIHLLLLAAWQLNSLYLQMVQLELGAPLELEEWNFQNLLI